jgi:hypothetical protein
MVEMNGQPYVAPSLSRFADVPGKKWYELEFTLPFKGSGTAGTANAPLGAALQACGYLETDGASDVTYSLVSSAASGSFYGPGKSATVKIYQDGMLHTAAGCMFDASWDMESGKIVGIKFKGKGIYAAVTDASFPTVTALTNNPPVFMSASLQVQSYAATAAKISFALNNEIAEIPDVNAATGILGFQIVGRNPGGSVDVNRTLVATHDFFGKMMSGAEASFTAALGGTAGNIITFSGSKMQYGQVKSGDRNGIASLEVPFMLNRSSGDDELGIVFT